MHWDKQEELKHMAICALLPQLLVCDAKHQCKLCSICSERKEGSSPATHYICTKLVTFDGTYSAVILGKVFNFQP